MRSPLVPIVALVCSLGVLSTGRANAHALLAEPAARDQQDGYKDGSACGVAFSATQPLTPYTAGQTLDVQWLETVDHFGCFLVEFSPGADQDFQILGRKSHGNPPPPDAATSAEPRHWSMSVTLPATPCTGCTLRLRQLMLDADVTADACSPTNAMPGSVYTTCANISLSAGASPGGPMPATAPSDSGCSMQPHRRHSLVLVAATLLMISRRRRQRPAGRSRA